MWRSALKGLLIFFNLGFIGCGVKGPPVPYVSTLPPSPSPIAVEAVPTLPEKEKLNPGDLEKNEPEAKVVPGKQNKNRKQIEKRKGEKPK